MQDLKDWDEGKDEVSVKDLQLMLKQLRKLRETYDELKKKSSEAQQTNSWNHLRFCSYNRSC